MITLTILSSLLNAQQQGPIDKFRVEFSVDQGSTWKERGIIVFDSSSRNRLQFRPTLTNDAKWSKDVIQIISDRILGKKKSDNLIYQIRVVNLNDNAEVMTSISMVGFLINKNNNINQHVMN